MPKKGIKLLEVEKGSIAERIGLMPGDEILTANGHELPDELALKFHLAEDTVDLCVRRPSGIEEYFEVVFSDSANLGVKTEEFRTKTCTNSSGTLPPIGTSWRRRPARTTGAGG